MALILTATVQAEQNRVIPLTQAGPNSVVVRTATATSGQLLVIQASGSAFPSSNLNWSISGNPAWVTMTVSPTDPSTITISYTNATPNAQGLFQFYVKVNDGDFVATYAIDLDVKNPFYISCLGSSNSTINLAAYDSTVAPSYLVAYGLSDVEITTNDVYYLQPQNLPSGLEMLIGVNNSLTPKINSRAILQVAQPSALDASGGVKVAAPYTQSLQIMAYQPNSMYDLPNDPVRTFVLTLTLNVNTSKKGLFNIATSCVFDDTNRYFSMKALPTFTGGQVSSLLYQWSIVSGGTGTIAGATTSQAHWAPSSASGSVTFNLVVKDAGNFNSDGSNVVLSNTTIGPFPYSNASNWNSTAAIEIEAPFVTQAAVGENANVTFAIPTPGGGETVTLVFTCSDVTLTMPSNLVLNAASPSGVVAFAIPTSSLMKKWDVTVTATNNTATRHGLAYIVIESAGLPLIAVSSSAGTSLTQATGSLISDSTLSFTYDASPVVPDAVYLVNPPAGINVDVDYIINGGSPINTADGSPFAFKVLAVKAGYTPSYLPITLAVTTVDTPIVFSSFSPSGYSFADNTPFIINWSYPATPATLFLQKNIEAPIQVTSNSYQSLIGDAVFSLVGTNFYGPAYAPPFLVTSSTTANLSQLPGSETVATINSSNLLTINWNPQLVNGTYSLYQGWLVNYSVNNGPSTQLTSGLITGLVGGTPAARVFTYQLTNDNIALSMRAMSANRLTIGDSSAWPDLLDFPTLPSSTSFTLNQVTAQMGESVTVIMESSYLGATSWRALYSDGFTTDWLPIALKSSTHAFSISGQQSVTIELENVYSLSPTITLKRTLTLPVFIENQTFSVGSVNSAVLGEIGLGGEAGFEITNASAPAYAPEPFEVITRSIVKDEVTQEVMLLVATSRNDNASSVQGTMALDVFPLAGRPHMKDLVVPSFSSYNTSLVPAVSIISESLPDAIVGQPMIETQLQATGGTAPYNWYSSSLPQGLTLTIDGTLSGTPMLMSAYSINISVKDSTSPAYIDSKTVTMNVVSNISINESSAPTANVGTFYSHAIPVSGGLAPYSWTLASGSLPIGLFINPTTGVIVGYPCSYSASDFTTTFLFTPQVTDSIGATTSKQLFMTLAPMSLTFGAIDQSIIYKNEDAKLVVPVYGGVGPYNNLTLTSDGSVGNVLTMQSPDAIDVVSGVAPSTLVISTGDQVFSPEFGTAHPGYSISFPIAVSGGIPGYKIAIDTSNNSLNTLDKLQVIDNVVCGVASATTHNYTVNVKCTDTDGFGTSVSKLINIYVNDNSTTVVPGIPTVTIEYISINKNTSNATSGWTFAKLSALPDAKENTPYAGSSVFYGIGLWNNDINQMYDITGSSLLSTPVAYGKLISTVQAGGLAQYAPIGISSGSSAIAIHSDAGTFAAGADLPLVYGDTSTLSPTTSNYVFALFADAPLASANRKIVRATDPINGLLTDYQIGSLTFYATNGTPLFTKSMPLYCATNTSGESTPVVIMTADNPQIIDGDTYDPGSTTFIGSDFYYPLSATGGQAPYTFSVLNGSTLPGATIGYANGGVPSLRVPSSSLVYNQTSATSYIAYITATDQNGIVSEIIPLVVNFTPKTSAANPVKITYYTYLQPSSQLTPTFRGYTGADLTPLDIQLKANQQVVWSLPANDLTNFTSLGLVFTTKPDNSFCITGTPNTAQRYIFNITASAIGAGSDTETFYLDIIDPIVKVNGPSSSLTLGAKYNFSSNSSIISVHYEGYTITSNPVVLHTNLGVLNPTPTNINITSDMGMGNKGNPAYAQKWDAVYDFTSTVTGNGLFSVTGAPPSTLTANTRASFAVAAPALIASGVVNAVQHVSEYAVTFTPAPPLSILGGVAPYTYSVASISNPINYAVNGSGQLELLMNSVSSTIQPGTCSVTYTVSDSSSPSAITVTSTPGTVSVIVDAENYIDISFLPKEWAYTPGTKSSFPLFGCITPNLGHAPYIWAITAIDFAGGAGLPVGFIVASPSNRILSYNTSSTNLPLQEFLSTDYLHSPTPGVWTASPSGGTYTMVPSVSAVPTTGRYAINVTFLVTDAQGITKAGSTTVTLVVP